MTTRIAIGDAWEKLKQIRSESINCCVTSPAYWMLRHYRSGPQEMGREPTIRQYLDKLLQVIDEIHRVLMPNGTFWLNIGDTYSTQSGKARGVVYPEHGKIRNPVRGALIKSKEVLNKSLCFVPERVALAMLDRGWICRNREHLAQAECHARWRERSLQRRLRAGVLLDQIATLLFQAAAEAQRHRQYAVCLEN